MKGQQPKISYFEKWVDPVAIERIAADGSVSLLCQRYDDPEAVNRAALDQAHGYQIAPRVELHSPWFADADLIARHPDLLAICSTGSGYDVIDVDACTASGIIVCNQAGANAQAVAEHAVAMMLALSKRLVATDRAVRRPEQVERFGYPGEDLYEKTVGIIGLGHIGRRIAEICRHGFNMRVLAHDPYLSNDEIEARGATACDLDRVLAESDFVSVNCPRTSETMGMFDASAFGRMKPTAHFINTARGGIHDEDDLTAALSARTIAGAGLDVFLQEPPAHDHPLLSHDNVIANPHIAGLTHESLYKMSLSAAEQWIAIFRGEIPQRLINPEVWPAYCERFEQAFGFRPENLKN
ncbi:MAG: hydroxyacid dehydrogenase [Sedimentitalea sp.]|uniref:hydroxyacid dehydrogenase n=1 Tax=Sedimentitalea sp. TaxID=2048915 RepID=UPI003264075C